MSKTLTKSQIIEFFYLDKNYYVLFCSSKNKKTILQDSLFELITFTISLLSV